MKASNDAAMGDLRKSYAQGEIVLFVGAGVSMAAGLPSWHSLVQALAEHARLRGTSAEEIQEIQELAGKRKFVDSLSAVKESLGPQEFGVAVERCLNDRDANVPEVIEAIKMLAPRLRAVLTTNLDRLLERGLGGDWEPIVRATADMAQRKNFILKLHGTLGDHSTWVLTRDSYDRAMYVDQRLQGVFSSLFFSRTLLFIGYGLSDDDFDHLLGRVRGLSDQQAPRHFAMVASEEIAPYRRKQLQASGLQIIAYDNSDGKHSELTALLRGLASAAAPAGTTAPDPRVLRLIMGVQARDKPLSVQLADALQVATERGDAELKKFCELELGGYEGGSGVFQKADPRFPVHRNVQGFMSLSEIDPDYVGWGGDASRAQDYMASDPEHFISFTMFFPLPMMEVERKAAESHKKKILKVTFPASSIVPGTHPAMIAHFYAPGDTLSDMGERVGALLTRKLIALLNR